MDFAKKQLEKFGWKEGIGLGKNEQGILNAIKPSLKVGTEGLGYDLSKELVDTWWTRAYDDSLNRIQIKESTANDTDENDESPAVTFKEDDEDDSGVSEANTASKGETVRPFHKMKKRLMKASFPTFSKRATLSNGEEMVAVVNSDSDDDAKSENKLPKILTDEQLLKVCGGRTAHKAARFGLKLNGKLARLAAQEAAEKTLQEDSHTPKLIEISLTNEIDAPTNGIKNKKKGKKKTGEIVEENNPNLDDCTTPLLLADNEEETEEGISKRKKKKKSKKHKLDKEDIKCESYQKNNVADGDDDSASKKNKKRKKLLMDEDQEIENEASESCNENGSIKKVKKSKKHKDKR